MNVVVNLGAATFRVFYDFTYKPVIRSIRCQTNTFLFERGVPVLFQKSDEILLSEASMLTLHKNDAKSLDVQLTAVLLKLVKQLRGAA